MHVLALLADDLSERLMEIEHRSRIGGNVTSLSVHRVGGRPNR